MIFLIGALGFLIQFKNKEYRLEFTKDKKKILLEVIFIINIFITIFLSVYYSYTSDYQPQGRYIMPILIPAMYFITKGLEHLMQKLSNKEKIYILVNGSLCLSLFVIVIVSMTHLIFNYMILF